METNTVTMEQYIEEVEKDILTASTIVNPWGTSDKEESEEHLHMIKDFPEQMLTCRNCEGIMCDFCGYGGNLPPC